MIWLLDTNTIIYALKYQGGVRERINLAGLRGEQLGIRCTDPVWSSNGGGNRMEPWRIGGPDQFEDGCCSAAVVADSGIILPATKWLPTGRAQERRRNRPTTAPSDLVRDAQRPRWIASGSSRTGTACRAVLATGSGGWGRR